jgi:hypothetical protein
MPDYLSSFVYYLIPFVVAIGLAALSSKTWVRIGRLGAAGIFFIMMAVIAHFESEMPVVFAVAYGATTLVGVVLLVGDIAGRFGRRETPR